MKHYDIPKGKQAAKCPWGCGLDVYWIETPRAGGKGGTARLPVDTSATKESSDPDSFSGGRGVNHFEVCERLGDHQENGR